MEDVDMWAPPKKAEPSRMPPAFLQLMRKHLALVQKGYPACDVFDLSADYSTMSEAEFETALALSEYRHMIVTEQQQHVTLLAIPLSVVQPAARLGQTGPAPTGFFGEMLGLLFMDEISTAMIESGILFNDGDRIVSGMSAMHGATFGALASLAVRMKASPDHF
jgi:hypothetical protein